MRPRKSSTLIKKGQSLLKSKQGFKNQQKKIERVQNNFTSVNQQQNKNSTMKNNSVISNISMNRTFLRQTKAHSLLEKKLPNTVINTNVTNAKVIKQNSINHKIVNSRILEKKQEEKGQQKIIKTPIRNIAQNSLHQQKISKSKVFSVTNPEEKKSINTNSPQMLNTRKSKFETDSNMKNLRKNQEKQKSNNIRSRNINIHPVKNSGVNNNIKKQSQEKVQIKNDSSLRQNEGNKGEVKIEQKSEVMGQQQQKKQEKVAQNTTLNQDVLSRNIDSDLTEPLQQIQNPIESSVQQRSINTQQNNSQSIQNINSNRIVQPVRVRQQQDRSLQNSQPAVRQVPQRQQQISNQNPQNQRNIDLASLISNTQDIIDFINRLNLNNRIPAFDLMVGQLVQLNLIAQQVHELGQIGNNLGYSLVNVFGTRIRQLQTTIINQVGIALISSFSQRIDPQFQALVIRQPSLRNGFSKVDIQKTFDEKLTFQQVECSICLENVKQGQRIIELQCYHEFHPICIKTWLQNSKKCPLCRAEQQRKTN